MFGGSGLLGNTLHKILLEGKYTVIAPQRTEINIEDDISLEEGIKKYAPDVIINAAALINVNSLEADPLLGWRVNALGAGTIARILRNAARRIPYILVSTSYVFSDTARPKREEDETSPVNVYGATKALGEHLVTHYATGLPFFIVRTGWLYGIHRPTFVDEVARTILQGKIFEASEDQFGNPTSTTDFSKALVQYCIEEERESGIYHLVNQTRSSGVSRYDIAREIAAEVKVSSDLIVPVKSDALFVAKRPSVALVNTKLPPLRDWREALREHLRGTF